MSYPLLIGQPAEDFTEEAERYPEWEPTLESTREPEEKLFSKRKSLGWRQNYLSK